MRIDSLTEFSESEVDWKRVALDVTRAYELATSAADRFRENLSDALGFAGIASDDLLIEAAVDTIYRYNDLSK